MGAEASPPPADHLLPLIHPRRRWSRDEICCTVIQVAALCLICTIFYLMAASIEVSHQPENLVAITGVGGLDPSRDLPNPMVSPVFNLTVHIKKLDRTDEPDCVGGHRTRLAVSYGGVLLGEGPLHPRLCVDQWMQGRGANTTAWGLGVLLPPFLRDQLAQELERHEAVLDVTVPLSDSKLLACKAKVGECLRPCVVVGKC